MLHTKVNTRVIISVTISITWEVRDLPDSNFTITVTDARPQHHSLPQRARSVVDYTDSRPRIQTDLCKSYYFQVHVDTRGETPVPKHAVKTSTIGDSHISIYQNELPA